MKQIKLIGDTIDQDDINHLIGWLRTNPKLTKGHRTVEFEKEWSKWLGTKHSLFVNSGSSANLLMIYALMISGKMRNKKIVVPALSWATDLAPIIQLGLEPILADCNLDNLAVDVNELEKIFSKEKPAALLLVSVLGFPPHMKEIVDLCKEHGVALIEDNCESLGTEYNSQKLGTFGEMSSFSLYFGHHMSCFPETPIPYLDEKGIFSIDRIDLIYSKYKSNPEKIKILCFDKKTKKIIYKNPDSIIKHKLKGKNILNLKLKNGSSVGITEDHSVFKMEKEIIFSIKGKNIKLNDNIIIPKILPEPKEINNINILKYIKHKDDIFIYNFDRENLKNIKCHWKSALSKSKSNYSSRKTIPLKYVTKFKENNKIGYKRQQKKNYIPINIKVDISFSRLIGFFIAEGSYKNKGLVFSFHIDEKEYVDIVCSDIRKVFGINSIIREKKSDKSAIIEINSKILKFFFKEILEIKPGAKNKRVPKIIFHSNKECKIAYLYGHFRGDGTYDSERIKLSSTSLELINDVSYLCRMLQISGSILRNNRPQIKHIKGKKTYSNGTYCFSLYNIDFNKNGTLKIIDKNRSTAYKKLENDKNHDLSEIKVREILNITKNIEYVYDFSVSGDENFIGGVQPICLHNSTIEGGMISTDDDELYDILKMARSHGWDRDLNMEKQNILREKWEIDDFSALYTFYIPGFNLRSTDLQAVIGLQQLKKLNNIIKKRNENYNRYLKNLKGKTWIPNINEYVTEGLSYFRKHYVSNFCMPIIDDNKEKIIKNLKENNIETRPLICGSMGTQPFYIEKYGRLEQPNVRLINEKGLYVPNHPDLTGEDIDFVCDIIKNSKYEK